MGNFKVSIDEVSTTVQTMKNIKTELVAAQEMAVQLLNDIQNDQDWCGNHKNELVALMDILTQYHKDLCYGEENPTTAIKNSLLHLEEKTTNYADESESYKRLQKL